MAEEGVTEHVSEEEVRERLQDAGRALQEIKAGRASGCRIPLFGRAVVENAFYYLGYLFAAKPPLVSAVVLVGVLACLGGAATGFLKVRVETDEERLWVETGGRLHEEQAYTRRYLTEDGAPTSEVFIQSVRGSDFRASLWDHLQLLQEIRAVAVHRGNRTYRLEDLCLKKAFPSTHLPLLDQVLEGLNPCLVITPLDCFWEGAFLHPPTHLLNITDCRDYAWAGNTTWANVNVTEVISCAQHLYRKEPFKTTLLASVQSGLDQSGTMGYNERPCVGKAYQDQDCPSKVSLMPSDELRGGCSGFATKAMKWPQQILAAGSTWGSDQEGAVPEALQTIIQLFGPAPLQAKLEGGDNSSLHDLEFYKDILTEWKKAFTQTVNGFVGSSDDDFHGWSSHSATAVVEAFSETNPGLIVAGYLLMLVYCAVAFARFDPVHSRAGAGVVGLLLIVLSVAGALGLCLHMGIVFNATSLHVLPFLVLGLGVDDMFVIGDAFFEQDDRSMGASIRQRVTSTLRQVGPNITLTSITNACGFFLAAIIPIPAMRYFAIQVGIAVVFNYFVIMLAFTSFIVIDTFRIQHGYLDLLYCVPAFWRGKGCCCHGNTNPDLQKGDSPTGVTMATIPPCGPCDDVGGGSEVKGGGGLSEKMEGEEDQVSLGSFTYYVKQARGFFSGHSVVSKLVGRFYSPLLQSHFVKVVVLVVLVAVAVPLAVVGSFRVRDGLDLLEVVPQGTPEHGFVSASFQHFSYYDMYVVTMEMDYAHLQPELMMLHDELLPLRHVVKGNGTETGSFWLKAMVQYYERFHQRICVGGEQGLDALLYQVLQREVGRATGGGGASAGGCQPLTRVVRRVVDEGERNFTIIPPEVFYQFITVWMAVDPVNAGVTQPEFHPPVPTWDPVADQAKILADNYTIPTSGRGFSYTQMPFYVEGLQATEDYVELITRSRSIVESYSGVGVAAYPRGVPFIFWEQYFGLRERVMMAIGLILLVSFLATSFFLMDLWSGVLLAAMLVLTTLEVFGFMGWVDIRFSAIPAVTLIVSVGIAVEATAPMSFFFLKASGSHNARMHQALIHRFTPILNGGISTFLGIVMLAFSPFPFITKYFFVLLLSCIVLSLVNGLLFFPVLLSLVGPPSQARIKGHPICQF